MSKVLGLHQFRKRKIVETISAPNVTAAPLAAANQGKQWGVKGKGGDRKRHVRETFFLAPWRCRSL